MRVPRQACCPRGAHLFLMSIVGGTALDHHYNVFGTQLRVGLLFFFGSGAAWMHGAEGREGMGGFESHST